MRNYKGLARGNVLITVWEDGFCDNEFDIVDSNGFSLKTLQEINESFKSLDWSQYQNSEVVIEPIWVPSQIGSYPPPNIESEGYWDYFVVESPRRMC